MNSELPDYTEQLAAFHTAFAAELYAAVQIVPATARMHVLDVGCGDGFYMELWAARLRSPGTITGLDENAAFLKLAAQRWGSKDCACECEYLQSKLSDLAQEQSRWDLVWCAQSLYSLPKPVEALRQMAAVLTPGGIVAVLENDTLHQLLLPWPIELELAVRKAEFAALQKETAAPEKFYVGRQLPAVFAEAGLEVLGYRTQSNDRRAPLDKHLTRFLELYLHDLSARVQPYLDSKHKTDFQDLMDSHSPRYLLHDPHFTLSWQNVLAWGRRVNG